MPERIAALLHTVRILLGYGRHLIDTVTHRAAAPNFTSIAVCFGTTKLSVILAHLQRGILRAAALERMLLARAATGRDVEFFQPRTRAREPQAAPSDPPPGQQPAAQTASTAAPRPGRRAAWQDPGFYLPTTEEFDAQVRRRPLGRSIVDICIDLAVVPAFCTGEFWNVLAEIMQYFGGSVATLMQERDRREKDFDREWDRRPTSNWHWWDLNRETIRKVLGFFIGETPVDPFGLSPPPVATAATGPP